MYKICLYSYSKGCKLSFPLFCSVKSATSSSGSHFEFSYFNRFSTGSNASKVQMVHIWCEFIVCRFNWIHRHLSFSEINPPFCIKTLVTKSEKLLQGDPDHNHNRTHHIKLHSVVRVRISLCKWKVCQTNSQYVPFSCWICLKRVVKWLRIFTVSGLLPVTAPS